MDLFRLRGAQHRRDRRPDLPNELARGVPVRARELRREAVIVENDDQLAKVEQVTDQCPELEHVIRIEGTGGAISMPELSERGAGRSESEWEQRWSSVTPEDICTFIYTSGT